MHRYRVTDCFRSRLWAVAGAFALFVAGRLTPSGFDLSPYYVLPILLTIVEGRPRWTAGVTLFCLILEAYSGVVAGNRPPAGQQFAMFCAIGAAGVVCARAASYVESESKARSRMNALVQLIEQAHRGHDENAVFSAAVKAIGRNLRVDRVRLVPLPATTTDGSPPVVHEWLAPGIRSAAVKAANSDAPDWSGRFSVIRDTSRHGAFAKSLRNQFEVKAAIVERISYGGRVAYLLEIHDCVEPRRWKTVEVEFLTMVAEHIELFLEALAAQRETQAATSEALERERRINRILERSLMPSIPTELAGVATGFVYRPAANERGIGGDVIDVFPLEGNRVALVIGDVAGHGVEAAAHTTFLRSLVRAYAVVGGSPASVINHLNSAMVRQLQSETFVTLFVGFLSSEDGVLQYASAGHEPPVIFRRNGVDLNILSPTGAVVGIGDECICENRVTKIDDGDIVVMYTDGLIEERSLVTLERFGVETLYECIRSSIDARRTLQENAANLWAAVAGLLGTDVMQDDAALLLVGRRDSVPEAKPLIRYARGAAMPETLVKGRKDSKEDA